MFYISQTICLQAVAGLVGEGWRSLRFQRTYAILSLFATRRTQRLI